MHFHCILHARVFQSVNLRQTAGRLGVQLSRFVTRRCGSRQTLHLAPSWQLRANKIPSKNRCKWLWKFRQRHWCRQSYDRFLLRRNACEYENSCYLHHIALLAKSQQQKRFNGISYLLKTSKKIVITILFFKLYSFFQYIVPGGMYWDDVERALDSYWN